MARFLVLTTRSMWLASMTMSSQDSTLFFAAVVLDTNEGPVNGIIHEYADHGKGSSIQDSVQLEWFKTQVDDSKVVGEKQCIESIECYALPLSIDSGLAYLHSIHPPTDIDLDSYTHVVLPHPRSRIQLFWIMASCLTYLRTLTPFQMIPILMINSLVNLV